MKRIKVYVSTNCVGSRCEREFSVNDDESIGAIEEIARSQMFEMIDWNWEEAE